MSGDKYAFSGLSVLIVDSNSPARAHARSLLAAFGVRDILEAPDGADGLAALEKFHHLPPSPLEKLERLEQLRFLENGIDIAVVETPHDTIGVDTEEDLRKVEECFRRLHSRSER